MRGVRGHADQRDLAGGRRGDAQVDGELLAPGPLPLHKGKKAGLDLIRTTGSGGKFKSITPWSTGSKVGI